MYITEENLKKALQKALENSVWKKEGKPDKVRKFDESLDLIVNLKDVDVRNPNNRINQEILVPYPFRDGMKLMFITDGDQLLEVKKKGLDYLDKEALSELEKKENKEKKRLVKKYDAFICQAPMMRDVARILGRFLGQNNKMPRPQPKGFGIVSPKENVDKILDNFRRRVVITMKKQPLIQTVFGKKSLPFEQNFENLKAVLNFIESQLPNGQSNIRSIYIKTTMGKPVKVEEPTEKRKGGKKKK